MPFAEGLSTGEKAMDYRKFSLGLGVFSFALGASDLFGARRIARKLHAPEREGLVRGFGVREIAAGAGLLAAPTRPIAMWNRVAGDAMDLAALGGAAGKSPRSRTVWSAIAFVVGATALDIFVARGLSRAT
jgi:hypothetical protein